MSQQNILVVDDEDVICDSLSGYLKWLGHTCRTANNGLVALEAMATLTYEEAFASVSANLALAINWDAECNRAKLRCYRLCRGQTGTKKWLCRASSSASGSPSSATISTLPRGATAASRTRPPGGQASRQSSQP